MKDPYRRAFWPGWPAWPYTAAMVIAIILGLLFMVNDWRVVNRGRSNLAPAPSTQAW